MARGDLNGTRINHWTVLDDLGSEQDTEDSIMSRLHYMKVYDCGNIKYIYSKEKEQRVYGD